MDHLKGDPEMTSLLDISLYDSKPVYMLTNDTDKIRWTKTEWKIWNKELQMMVNVPFHHVNVIDQYNFHMNNLDISDQIRRSYNFDHWLWKQKWWWVLFFVCFEMLLTNSYIHK